MSDLTVGFIGFGEAASCFSKHLKEQPSMRLLVFCNGRTNRPPYSEAFLRFAGEAGATTMDTLAELCGASDVIFSAVLVANALEVAREATSFLKPGTLYVDISASTPSKKRQIAAAIEAGGGLYVDANLMGSVAIYGAPVTLYCSGSGVSRFAELFIPRGMTIDVANDRAGDAAMVKMLRSVVTKGIEALVVEAFTIATLQGVRGEVMTGLFGSMDKTKFSDFVGMCILTDVLHSERRAVEMDEIATDIRAMELDPIMTEAAGRRLWASARLGLREAFVGRKDATLEQVLDAYAAAIKTGPPEAGTSRRRKG
ncbi:NAD(P)-dependent oxidoreductase [Agrobacterium vitis]|uniref:NAD(P)-dependent oxidoreductase n=1 Tax=Agrobacterium vitis TaxID=373 RepID=A0A1S2EA20_AGRVI|nr:NAD(P)-dependent oxidoreductase [Agrobacterium vitis]MCM2467314.1 NAD(P)-dependent oxidoreductase [Agrobacterium vitis]MUO68781.1 NAD(P)-dependent oxidoreductase [Agrobacterium vitis]MUO79804.1 NAD(P)-dependent oxidoreductase [Agrobacterium vitis]MUO93707.1 NAD(P)-dependent oxidoreductase [Agrobacterium vitis]MUP04042.1 NAD(P)-dependent oxidoreductase [Agrobacterium vitis]